MNTHVTTSAALRRSPDETLRRVREAITGGQAGDLGGLVASLDRQGVKAAADAAREIRRGLSDHRPWERPHMRACAGLIAAAASTFTSPAEAARWLGARELQGWDRNKLGHILTLLSRRDATWRADVARRLADRRPTAWGPTDGLLVEYLVRAGDLPVPTSDGFVTAWARTRQTLAVRTGSRPFHVPFLLRQTLPTGADLTEVLRADAFLPTLLPRLFEVDQLGSDLLQEWFADAPGQTWTGALTTLAAEGVIDRRALIGLCTARLLRGGRLIDIRFALHLLDALAPTVAEDAERATDLLRLLPDSPSPVAGHAQAALARLDAEGQLTPDQLVEASAAVFFRPEKKLLRAQLQLLDRAAARPEGPPAVLRSLAHALGMDDRLLLARAWRLTERLLKRADTVPAELRDAADQLADPDLRARAARLLGLPDDAAPDPYTEPDDGPDALPAPVTPPFPAPPDTPAALAEELAVLLTGRGDTTTFERALAALVRLAHRDRDGLRETLAPLAESRPFQQWYAFGDITGTDIAAALAALTGRTDLIGRLLHNVGGKTRARSAYGKVIGARIEEVAQHLAPQPPRPWPCLLATPCDGAGTVTPAALLDRLRAHHAHGTVPGPADLGQALLRLTVPADRAEAARLAAEADAIGGGAAHATARVLRAGPPVPAPATVTERTVREKRRDWFHQAAARRVQVSLPETAFPVPLDARFSGVLAPVPSLASMEDGSWSLGHPLWAWVTPHHPELLAARLQHHIASMADSSERGPGARLPELVAADAPVGPAVHLALAHGLAARHAEDRTAAVDALLVLAARDRLDPALLGRLAAEAAHRTAVKGSRLAEGLAEAADAGARHAVGATVAAALPPMLAEPPVGGTRHSGLAELLALGTRCLPRGATEPALRQAVEEIVARGGSSRLAHEARRLRTALG